MDAPGWKVRARMQMASKPQSSYQVEPAPLRIVYLYPYIPTHPVQWHVFATQTPNIRHLGRRIGAQTLARNSSLVLFEASSCDTLMLPAEAAPQHSWCSVTPFP